MTTIVINDSDDLVPATMGISVGDALTALNGNYGDYQTTCPTCGEKNCKIWEKQKADLLKIKGEKEKKKRLVQKYAQGNQGPMSGFIGLRNEFNEIEPMIKREMERNGYPYTKLNQKYAFANFVESQKHCGYKNNIGGIIGEHPNAGTVFKHYPRKIRGGVATLVPSDRQDKEGMKTYEDVLTATRQKDWEQALRLLMGTVNFAFGQSSMVNALWDELEKEKGEQGIPDDLADNKKAFDTVLTGLDTMNKKFGETFGKEAKKLLNEAQSKNIRSKEDALKMYDKYLKGKPIKPRDVDAVRKALDAVDLEQAANYSKAFGKILKGSGYISNGVDLFNAAMESYEKQSFEPLIYTVGSIGVSNTLGYLVGLALAPVSGPLAIVAGGITMALGAYFLDDTALKGMVDSISKQAQKFENNPNYMPRNQYYYYYSGDRPDKLHLYFTD